MRQQGTHGDNDLKHQPGGLVDIEFVTQLGVLVGAFDQPALAESTSTLDLIPALSGSGWLNENQADVLADNFRNLQQQRMIRTLTNEKQDSVINTTSCARLCSTLLGMNPD